MRRATALPGLALVAAVLGGSALVAPAAHAALPAEDLVEGTYERLVVDPHGGAAFERDLLVTAQGSYDLEVPTGAVAPGSTVRAALTQDGDARLVAAVDTGTVQTASLGGPSAGPRTDRVLLILATWTQPDHVTPEQAASQLFTDSNAWFREVSHGAYGITGDVTPWLRIAGPDGGQCLANGTQAMKQAETAARAAGFDPSGYTRTVLYFPAQKASDCAGYAGWAYQPGSRVWLNGTLDRRTSVHELGHSLGLAHAHRVECTTATGVRVVYAHSGCVRHANADAYDAMGESTLVAQFSAAQRAQLGWASDRVVDLSAGGQASLVAPGAPTGSAAVRLALGTRTYWLERRTATGADARLPRGATEGVQVRVQDSSLGPGLNLLDGTPDGNAVDVVIPFGASRQLPEGLWISVGVPTGDGTPVHVGAVPLPTPVQPFTTAVARSTSLSCPAGAFPAAGFTDVTAGSPHRPAIDCLAWWRVVAGRTATSYAPEAGVTREAMAAFIARVIDVTGTPLPHAVPDAFHDDGRSAHHESINRLAAAGIIGGAGGGRYNPGAPVTRGQMAKFLAGAAQYVQRTPLVVGRDFFADDASSPFQEAINKVAQAGLTGGRADGTYGVADVVTRGQMASFLARTLDLLVAGGYAAPR